MSVGQQQQAFSGEVRWTPLYEKSAIENLRIGFLHLVNADPPEESLQKIIEDHPVILHQFPAERLFFKPPILTRFKEDFHLVTPQKEPVLIASERTRPNLLKIRASRH